jgi:predicted nucleotidyltransferase
MALTALELSPTELKRYHPMAAIRRRRQAQGAELAKRRRRALAVARKAAKLLKSEFDATEVILFGSLARRGCFTRWSDIDLAAKGIPPLRFYEAVGVVIGLSAEFKIDLIDLNDCSASMRANIAAEGKPL